MFSQSTTIHYNPLRHAELSPAMLFKTYGACGCNRHQRPRVRAGGAREEPHPVGFQGSTSAEKVSPRLRNIRKPDSQRVIENPSYN